MRTYKLSLSDDFSNAEEMEINRNLRTLFDTRAGTQPVDRDFGISWDCLDETPEAAENLFATESYEKVSKYEPRVEIEEISFITTESVMIPQIRFAKRGEG